MNDTQIVPKATCVEQAQDWLAKEKGRGWENWTPNVVIDALLKHIERLTVQRAALAEYVETSGRTNILDPDTILHDFCDDHGAEFYGTILERLKAIQSINNQEPTQTLRKAIADALGMTHTVREEPVTCPGPDCPSCSGETCGKCGAGCWDQSVKNCDHDVSERHEKPTI